MTQREIICQYHAIEKKGTGEKIYREKAKEGEKEGWREKEVVCVCVRVCVLPRKIATES